MTFLKISSNQDQKCWIWAAATTHNDSHVRNAEVENESRPSRGDHDQEQECDGTHVLRYRSRAFPYWTLEEMPGNPPLTSSYLFIALIVEKRS
jgi:hypothetical protein